jgi:hypothetical protein
MKYISLSLQNIPELVVPLMIPFIEGASNKEANGPRAPSG